MEHDESVTFLSRLFVPAPISFEKLRNRTDIHFVEHSWLASH